MLPGLDKRTDPPEASISHLLANKEDEITKDYYEIAKKSFEYFNKRN